MITGPTLGAAAPESQRAQAKTREDIIKKLSQVEGLEILSPSFEVVVSGLMKYSQKISAGEFTEKEIIEELFKISITAFRLLGGAKESELEEKDTAMTL